MNSGQDSEAPPDGIEEGEEMGVANEDDSDMMAMMGMSGFGTTKVSDCAFMDNLGLESDYL